MTSVVATEAQKKEKKIKVTKTVTFVLPENFRERPVMTSHEIALISQELRKQEEEAKLAAKAAKQEAHQRRLKEQAERKEKKNARNTRLVVKKQPLLQTAASTTPIMNHSNEHVLTSADNKETALEENNGSTCVNTQDIKMVKGHIQMKIEVVKGHLDSPIEHALAQPISGDFEAFERLYHSLSHAEQEEYIYSGVILHNQLRDAYRNDITEILKQPELRALPNEHPMIVWATKEITATFKPSFIATPYPGFKYPDGTVANGIHECRPKTQPICYEVEREIDEPQYEQCDEVDMPVPTPGPEPVEVEGPTLIADEHAPSTPHTAEQLEALFHEEHKEALDEDYARVRLPKAPISFEDAEYDASPVNIVTAILRGRQEQVPSDLAYQYHDAMQDNEEILINEHGHVICDHDFLLDFIQNFVPDVSLTVMRKYRVLDSTRNEMRITTQFVVVRRRNAYALYLARQYTPTLDNAYQLPPATSTFQRVNGAVIGACSRDATETILRDADRAELVPALNDLWRNSVDEWSMRKGGASRALVFTMIQFLNTHGITAAYVQDLGEKAWCHTSRLGTETKIALKSWTGYLIHCAYKHAIAMKVGIQSALPTLPEDAIELPSVVGIPMLMFADENGSMKLNYTCLLDACKAIYEHATIPNFDLRTYYKSILTSADSPLSTWETALKMIEKLRPHVGHINLILRFGCFWDMSGFPTPVLQYPTGYTLHIEDNHCVAVYRPRKPTNHVAKALKWATLTILTMTLLKVTIGSTNATLTPEMNICTINGSTSDDRYYGELQMEEEPMPTSLMMNVTDQSATSTQGSTTKFVDANITRDMENNVTSTDADNLDYLHSIQTILARPTLIKETVLDKRAPGLTLFGPQVPLVSVDIPLDVMKKGNKLSKIANFAYFRATTVIKVMVNANPFTSGKLWICMAPMDKTLVASAAIANKSKVAVTSYPGVELDLQVNKNIEIEIPWTYPEESRYPWSTLDSTVLNVYAMSPLQGPAGFTINMQVFGWLKDVVLRGPTIETVPGALQADDEPEDEPPVRKTSDLLKETSTTLKVLSDILALEHDGAKISQLMLNNTYLSVVKSRNSMCTLRESITKALAKGHLEAEVEEDPDNIMSDETRRSLNQMDQEMPESKKFTIPPVSREAKGPIARIAGHVSRIASVASHFPVISTFTKPVQWVSDIVGVVANIFGWSRPVEGSGAPAMTLIPGRGMAQTVCTDQAVILGYSNLNELSTKDTIFLRKEDEMETEFISARPGLIDVVPYNTTSSGTLAVELAGAQTDIQRIEEITGNLMRTFKIAPTCFEYLAHMTSHWRADLHFRVSVAKTAFHTGRLEIVYVPGPRQTDPKFDATNCYRAILDLSRQNEMEFVVPFVSLYEMQEVTMNTDLGANGCIYIRALTPLLCPDNVSQTVDIFIWKWASNVALAGTTQSTPGFIPAVKGELQMDVGIDTKIDKFVCYGGQTTKKQNIEVAQRVCGELLTNARLLTRAHRKVKPAVGSTTILSEIKGESDYLGYLGSMFAYFRGGLSYKIVSTGEMKGAMVTTQLNRSLPTDPFQPQSSFHITCAPLNFVHEVMVPFYSKTRKLVNNQDMALTESRSRMAALDIIAEGDPTYDIYRAGKDDFSMGCLIGPARYTYVYQNANPGMPWTYATLPTEGDYDYQEGVAGFWKAYWLDVIKPPNPTMADNTAAMISEANAFLLNTYGVPGGTLNPFHDFMGLWSEWLQAHHPAA